MGTYNFIHKTFQRTIARTFGRECAYPEDAIKSIDTQIDLLSLDYGEESKYYFWS